MSHRRLVGRGLASIGLLVVVAVAAAPASAVTKVVTEFKIKTAANQPGDMAVGANGNVWFVDANTSKVAQISKTGGITGYLTHTANSKPTGITLGPDGAMWFTESAVNKIGRINAGPPAADFPLPAGTSPRGITTGTDGDLYFTEYTTHAVAKMDPTTHVATRRCGAACRQRSDSHRERPGRQPVGDRDGAGSGRTCHARGHRHPGLARLSHVRSFADHRRA